MRGEVLELILYRNGTRERLINKPALKESFNDTVLGTLLNFPLNYILIAFCLSLNMTALNMTIFMTSILFILAVIRKYCVRVYYSKKDKVRYRDQTQLLTFSAVSIRSSVTKSFPLKDR